MSIRTPVAATAAAALLLGSFAAVTSAADRTGAVGAEVRQLAERMIADHGEANAELQAFASRTLPVIEQHHQRVERLEGAIFRDLRVQVQTDGVFHLLMYVVAVVGLWKLWSASRDRRMPGDGRLLLAPARRRCRHPAVLRAPLHLGARHDLVG